MEEELKKEIKSSKINSLNEDLLDMKPKKIKDEKDIKDSEPIPPITLSRKMRWIVFIIFIYIVIVDELDQGVLSSTTDDLSKDLEINDSQLGGLGSMIFLGKAIGCLVFFVLINKFNRKYMQLITLFLTVLSLILTTQTKNIILLYLCRIVVGFAQSYVGIYLPVWSDQFAIHKHKSMFLMCQHLSSSLGSLFGYVLGIWLGWELSFYVQNIMLVIPIIGLFFINDKYFSISLMPIKSKLKLLQDNEKEKKEKKDDKIEKEINKIKVTILDESYDEEKLNEENKEENKEEEKTVDLNDDISLFEDIQQKGENMSKGAICSQIKAIIKSPVFILINITLCSIYAIVAAIQFWIIDYLQYGLFIEDPKKRFLMFGSVIVTSPPLGMILGGVLLSKVGGYDSEKAIYIPLFTSLIVSVLANLAPLSTNVYIFLPLFWLYFFVGSAIIPAANGISLVSVEKKYAGAASSISILLYNVLGRFPGPNLYAFFKSLVDDENSRIPMGLLLNVSVIGFLAVLISLKFNKQKYKKIREESLIKEQEEKEEKNKKKNIDNENNIEEVETLIVDGNNNKEKEENNDIDTKEELEPNNDVDSKEEKKTNNDIDINNNSEEDKNMENDKENKEE